MSRRICLALDLVDDADLIAEYDHWHRVGNTDPAVIRSIRDAGISDMQIYRAHDRLFMIIEASDAYSDDAKAAADAANPPVVAWVAKMTRFQQPIPAAGPDGTWYPMDRIFRLTDHQIP
ncbi:L-rhamnose mutarotase [Sphingomonas faeni]|uniref:L-rhamnose mutarotase n=1 Tax=Sphingomonas faeni TaxID=185950 RepID=UPI00277F0A1B|nr:L-rhamnose mutarotase [Sphingomonas faeni]MDQ0839908.1 L-rhamnose mutarotase [Sphingomonas faeni]